MKEIGTERAERAPRLERELTGNHLPTPSLSILSPLNNSGQIQNLNRSAVDVHRSWDAV